MGGKTYILKEAGPEDIQKAVGGENEEVGKLRKEVEDLKEELKKAKKELAEAKKEAEKKGAKGDGEKTCPTCGEEYDEDDTQGERRQAQAERVEAPGGEQEDGGGNGDESPGETAREQAGGQMAHAGARVAGVQIGIHQAVEGHGGGARGYHGHHDPGQLHGARARVKSLLAEGQQGAGERERQSEDGMLELDHFERKAQALEEHQ